MSPWVFVRSVLRPWRGADSRSPIPENILPAESRS